MTATKELGGLLKELAATRIELEELRRSIFQRRPAPSSELREPSQQELQQLDQAVAAGKVGPTDIPQIFVSMPEPPSMKLLQRRETESLHSWDALAGRIAELTPVFIAEAKLVDPNPNAHGWTIMTVKSLKHPWTANEQAPEVDLLRYVHQISAKLVAAAIAPAAMRGREEGARYRFRLIGDMWEIRYDGESGNFSDLKGFGIIAKLLKSPNPQRPMTAAELLGRNADDAVAEHTQQPALDPEALRAYREQIAEYDRDIEQANESGDEPKAESLTREKNQVIHQLKAATRIGNGVRSIGPKDPAKSAQVAARQAVKRVRDQVAKTMPRLAEHLRTSLNIGEQCSYRPSNPAPSWMPD